MDNVTVTIKLRPGVSLGCQISVKNTFSLALRIRPGETVTFTFTCSTPEKYFIMEIQKNIGKMHVSISSPHGGFLPVKPFSYYYIKVSHIILGKKKSLDANKNLELLKLHKPKEDCFYVWQNECNSAFFLKNKQTIK